MRLSVSAINVLSAATYRERYVVDAARPQSFENKNGWLVGPNALPSDFRVANQTPSEYAVDFNIVASLNQDLGG